jgi:choline dehydrogenase-like flavoprotein
VNFNGVGGGTVMYTAHFPRLHPSDFRVKTLDGVADDWPIDYATLEPFFAENDRMMGVSGLAGDPAYPPQRTADAAAAARPLRRDAARKAMNRLGWHWWPSDTAIATQDYEGRAPCINLGHCTRLRAGRQGQHRHHLLAGRIRAGVELRTRCRVREITTNEHGMASGVVYYDAEGWSSSSRPRSSSSPATASARRGCC